MNGEPELRLRSQFFHRLRFFSSQAKRRLTNQRLGITLKACSSVLLGDLHCHVLTQRLLYALFDGLPCLAAVA